MTDAVLEGTLRRRLRTLLGCMYGSREDEAYAAVSSSIGRHADQAAKPDGVPGRSAFSEADALLISYGDMIAPPLGDGPEARESALARLGSFLDAYAPGLFSYLHILPFYPYSSDDGFSVKDYRAVNPSLGSWDDVAALGGRRKLAFDLVLNHASAQGQWFRAFLARQAPYDRYFITRPVGYDASTVTRPRTHPLITPYELRDGTTAGVWTTFSADQVDLDFSEPAVLAEFIDILLFYAEKGARLIRLDAIAYLWKKDGTSCVHLPQTHAAVKAMRLALEILGLDVKLLTETNVPHAENMSYFGDGDEAHMVYNFSLPPLVLHAFVMEDASALSSWATRLEVPPGGVLLNFLASHDGIGVTPAYGLVDDFSPVLKAVAERGGLVSYKASPKGPVPYELNISWADAVAPAGADCADRASALLASYAVAFAMDGVPAVYFHSLVGSRSWMDGPTILGHNRAINRQRLAYDDLAAEVGKRESMRGRVLEGFRRLIRARAGFTAFSPSSPRVAFPAQGPVFSLERGAGADALLVAINCSGGSARFVLPAPWRGGAQLMDPLAGMEGEHGGRRLTVGESVDMPPYAVRWFLGARHQDRS